MKFSPVVGDQAYVLAPPTVKVVETPAQMVVLDETVNTGKEFIVTLTVAVLEHPPTAVPVTV